MLPVISGERPLNAVPFAHAKREWWIRIDLRDPQKNESRKPQTASVLHPPLTFQAAISLITLDNTPSSELEVSGLYNDIWFAL